MTAAVGSVSSRAREVVERRAKNPVTVRTIQVDSDRALRLFAEAIGAPHLRSANHREAEEALVRDRIAPCLGRRLEPGKLDWVVSEIGESLNETLRVRRGAPGQIVFEGKVVGADEKVKVTAALTSTPAGQTLELTGFPEHLLPIAGVHASEKIWVFNETTYGLDDALARASSFAALDRNKQDHG